MSAENRSAHGLTELGLLILRSIPKNKGLEEIARLGDVPPMAVGKEIAALQLKGFIGEDGLLTQKGREASQP
jgi:hypothetical protein